MRLQSHAVRIVARSLHKRLHDVAGIRVICEKWELTLKNYRILARTPEFEGSSGGAHLGGLGALKEIAHLVYLDGQPGAFGPMSREGEKQREVRPSVRDAI